MSQKLILPINKSKVTASIDTGAYLHQFGFRHYGADMVSLVGDTRVWGSGKGKVVSTGWDNSCGNIVVIVYEMAQKGKGNQVKNITFRYFHLSKISVSIGQMVTKDTLIGRYGNTGRYAGNNPHLHLEADLDTQYVLYTPTVTSSNFLKGTAQGAISFDHPQNTVENPIEWIYCKKSSPDLQSYSTAKDQYIRIEDQEIPLY